jgi:hypothetical protein
MLHDLEVLDDLRGAKILEVWVQKPPNDDVYDQPCVRLRVKFREGLRVNDLDWGEYEIWQDEEGNGPGHLAFVEPSRKG